MKEAKLLIEARKERAKTAKMLREVSIMAETLRKKEEFLANERRALTDWAKRLKYAQLKISKLLKERELDEGIRELINE